MTKLVVAVLMAMTVLVSCSDEKADNRIEGEFTVIWDRGAGPSFEQHFANHLMAKFPDATFEQTFIVREFRFLGGGRDVYHPLDVYDIAEKDLPGDIIMFESTLAPYLFKSGYLEPLEDHLSTVLGIVDRRTAGRWILRGNRETAPCTAFLSAKMCMRSTTTPRFLMNWAFPIRPTE